VIPPMHRVWSEVPIKGRSRGTVKEMVWGKKEAREDNLGIKQLFRGLKATYKGRNTKVGRCVARREGRDWGNETCARCINTSDVGIALPQETRGSQKKTVRTPAREEE